MKRYAWSVLALALVGIPAKAQELTSATYIVETSQQAFYYPEADMKAKVTMELVTEDGKTRTRVLMMLRKNVPGSQHQKYFLYFHEPGDVRRTAFLVWKYPDRDDDRWIFIPAVNMVRRVAASDSRSSFVGSDFTYEDISGRDLSADTHTLVRQEKLGAADCYVIQSIPNTAAEYTKKLAWIDANTFLPRKEEYYDAQNELARVLTADAVEDVAVGEGDARKTVPTITRRTMNNVKSGHRTEVRFDSVAYDVGLDDAVFVERALQNPPRKWIE
jgi:outer membrane lipoprotein-sorting protein